MLVLSRRVGEEVIIASNIRVRVLDVHGNSVKLGFSAPEETPIIRSELVHGTDGVTKRGRPPILEASGTVPNVGNGKRRSRPLRLYSRPESSG